MRKTVFGIIVTLLCLMKPSDAEVDVCARQCDLDYIKCQSANKPACTSKRNECAKKCKGEAAKRGSGSGDGSAAKCGSGTDARQCVTLEQRGRSGRWHNFRLVNVCSTAF